MKSHTKTTDELNRHDAAQGVTTNPRDAGRGGSTPVGAHGQDSRTWRDAPNDGNPVDGSVGETDREARSKTADAGAADAQDAGGSDDVALPPGRKHEKRSTM